MDESEAVQEEPIGAATPIFNVYRRGYDPEQVDRYVGDQQRRLDDALHRASESERKLAAAVGQLRELHRRVAVYESEARSAQPPALDTLGERVQRILQEAWEGAYNLRQEAEREVSELRDDTQRELDGKREQAEADVVELREVAGKEAAELVDAATRHALALRDEMDRRRQAYLERVERDRQRAVSQITFLYDQRQLAISELARLQTNVQAIVEEMVQSPLGKPSAAVGGAASGEAVHEDASTDSDEEPPPAGATMTAAPPTHAASGTQKASLFFDRIIDEGRDLAAPVADEAMEASAPWERPGDQEVEGTVVGESPAVVDAREVPTGPMDAVDYGYDAPYRTDATRGSDDLEEIAPASTMPEDVEPEAEPRVRRGVFDVEADG